MKTFGRLMSLVSGLLISMAGQAEFYNENGELIEPPIWAYDAGPMIKSSNSETKSMADELVQLNADIPYFPGVSTSVMGSQKFRPAFGPISWRMLLEKNSVKILFIGQDGTHIAEAAGRPATAGFGGRAHDLANHFGVDYSAAFINTYAFTIRGQYGARGVPYLKNGRLNFTSQYLDNELWLMSQDKNSPIVQWRNRMIDWIIKNNPDSLKMIVTFGGSARDTISSYIDSKQGATVGTRLSWDELAGVRMPEFKLKYAGGNNNFPVPLDRNGRDLYQELLGKEPNYVPPHEGVGQPDDQFAVQNLLRDNIDVYQNKMVFSRGGYEQSGLIHPAQLGGYDISKISINNRETISLKGLKIDGKNTVRNHVLVVDLPHPTYLSNVQRSQGTKKVSDLVEQKTGVIRRWMQKTGIQWSIQPDAGLTSNFADRKDYNYGRGTIGPEYYDFGTPNNRMVSKSDAKRIDAESILLGSRKDKYLSKYGAGMAIIQEMKEDGPAEAIDPTEMFISISRSEESREDFDPGPGEELAKLMKTTLYGEPFAKKGRIFYRNLEAIKDSKSTITDISKVGDYGHYRGRADSAKVLVLADPQGYDGIITSRALTGTRGQYLQGLIANGITEGDWSESQFILKTVPFGMDGAPGQEGATEDQWNSLIDLTKEYREEVIKYVLDASDPILVIADGKYAQREMKRILSKLKTDPQYQDEINRIGKRVVNIDRTWNNREDMQNALVDINLVDVSTVNPAKFEARRANIPSSHLTYYARVWEGTSKDRVITSETDLGVSFAEVVPNWVVRQNLKFSTSTGAKVNILTDILYQECLPKPGEKPADFIERKAKGGMPQECNI